MGDVPIDIHVDKAQAWLEDRSSKSSRLRSLRNLVEPAKFLVAATEYELPALVRKTERVYLQIKDSLSKEEEYGKRADAARRRSAAACEEWDLRTERRTWIVGSPQGFARTSRPCQCSSTQW